MSILAHAIIGTPGMEPEKRVLDGAIQHEVKEAKRIQQQTGCTWTEALHAAYNHPFLNPLSEE